MLRARLEVKASSMIFNPDYTFPLDRCVQMFPERETAKGTRLTNRCKVSLPAHGLTLVFDDDRITFFGYPEGEERPESHPLVPRLLDFIIFKTFVKYNFYGFPKLDSTVLVDVVREAEAVTFNLGKLVEREQESLHRDQKIKWHYLEVEPCTLTLKSQDIQDFLVVADDSLYLSMRYYPVGCENSQYFLIEYYKSVETIYNHFGNEKSMEGALQPYGFRLGDYERLRRYANDQRKALNIGRHAPHKGTKLLHVDVKRLLEEPLSRRVFEDCSHTCRASIEAFMSYLKASLHIGGARLD